MPDERMDSLRQGIGAPPESPAAKRAERERLRKSSHDPPIEGALGGTSDADTAGDEARADAERGLWREPEEEEGPREERRKDGEP